MYRHEASEIATHLNDKQFDSGRTFFESLRLEIRQYQVWRLFYGSFYGPAVRWNSNDTERQQESIPIHKWAWNKELDSVSEWLKILKIIIIVIQKNRCG